MSLLSLRILSTPFFCPPLSLSMALDAYVPNPLLISYFHWLMSLLLECTFSRGKDFCVCSVMWNRALEEVGTLLLHKKNLWNESRIYSKVCIWSLLKVLRIESEPSHHPVTSGRSSWSVREDRYGHHWPLSSLLMLFSWGQQTFLTKG